MQSKVWNREGKWGVLSGGQRAFSLFALCDPGLSIESSAERQSWLGGPQSLIMMMPSRSRWSFLFIHFGFVVVDAASKRGRVPVHSRSLRRM